MKNLRSPLRLSFLSPFFYLYIGHYNGWFRLLNFGIYWKNLRKCDLSFSERNLLASGFKVGNYFIGRL